MRHKYRIRQFLLISQLSMHLSQYALNGKGFYSHLLTSVLASFNTRIFGVESECQDSCMHRWEYGCLYLGSSNEYFFILSVKILTCVSHFNEASKRPDGRLHAFI